MVRFRILCMFNAASLCVVCITGPPDSEQTAPTLQGLRRNSLASYFSESNPFGKRQDVLSALLLALGTAPSLQHRVGSQRLSSSREHSFLHLPSRSHVESVSQPKIFMSAQESETSFWRNKRVLLVGASSGLGEALALELASRGADLVLAARRADRLTSLSQKCANIQGASVPFTLAMDVTSSQAILAAKVEEAIELLNGPIDVLLYTAGMGQRTTAVETSMEDHRRLMATNFDGAVALAQVVVPSMLARRTGNVVVVSSVQGRFGQPGRSSYAASKAAMIGYFDALRAEVSQYKVRVSVVAPGYIATDHASSAVGNKDGSDDAVKKGMPPETLATQIADGVEKGREEIVVSQLDGKLAILLRTLWPSALFRIMEGKARKS